MEAISTVFRRSPGKTKIKFCINNKVNYDTQNANANKIVNVRSLGFSLQEVTKFENDGKTLSRTVANRSLTDTYTGVIVRYYRCRKHCMVRVLSYLFHGAIMGLTGTDFTG